MFIILNRTWSNSSAVIGNPLIVTGDPSSALRILNSLLSNVIVTSVHGLTESTQPPVVKLLFISKANKNTIIFKWTVDCGVWVLKVTLHAKMA